jgi:hypothetical protein
LDCIIYTEITTTIAQNAVCNILHFLEEDRFLDDRFLDDRFLERQFFLVCE